MKLVTLMGGQSFYIADEKYEPLKEHMNIGTIVEVTATDGQSYIINPKSIMHIRPAGAEAPRQNLDQNRLEAPPIVFDPDGPGFKRYMAMRDKLKKKWDKK